MYRQQPTTVYRSFSLLEMWMGPAQNSVLRAALSSGEQYLRKQAGQAIQDERSRANWLARR